MEKDLPGLCVLIVWFLTAVGFVELELYSLWDQSWTAQSICFAISFSLSSLLWTGANYNTQTRPYQIVSLFSCVTFYVYIIHKWWDYALQAVLYICLCRGISHPLCKLPCVSVAVDVMSPSSKDADNLSFLIPEFISWLFTNCPRLLGELIRTERSK